MLIRPNRSGFVGWRVVSQVHLFITHPPDLSPRIEGGGPATIIGSPGFLVCMMRGQNKNSQSIACETLTGLRKRK